MMHRHQTGRYRSCYKSQEVKYQRMLLLWYWRDDNFATIVKAVENGRNVYQNIKNSIQFLLSGNWSNLAVLYASIAGLPVPFAPVHLLFINLLTDSLPAIALGLEPHSKKVMDEKPGPMNESILTKISWQRSEQKVFCIESRQWSDLWSVWRKA